MTPSTCVSHRATRFAAFATMVLLAFAFFVPGTAFANPTTSTITETEDSAYGYLGNDYFSAGVSSSALSQTVGANAFMAGSNVTLSNSSVAADAFLAGSDVVVSGATVGNCLFAAGNSITVDSTAKLVYAAGNVVSVKGTYDNVNLAASAVSLSGTVNGDAELSGDKVTIADGTVVTGTLYVQAETEPVIPANAKIGNYTFEKSSDTSTKTSEAETGAAMAGMGIAAILGSFLFTIFSMLLIGALLLWIATVRPFDGSAKMLKTRPAPMLVSGLVVFLALPLAVLITLCTIIGVNIAIALVLAACLVGIFAGTFTALSFGRLIMPNMNKWLSGLIWILIFAIAFSVPFLGGILAFFCVLYLVGYLIQTYWLWRRGAKAAANTPPVGNIPPVA